MITHYDLFAGIGGNSIALEEVFSDEPIRHIFCEWEQFPTAVLKKHWPDGEYWGDIADLVADTSSTGARMETPDTDTQGRNTSDQSERKVVRQGNRQTNAKRVAAGDSSFTIVTGGFPCQPFSAAGRRKGTADDRYKWPEMFAVIQNVRPDWVVAENVRGLTNWSDGMVLEQVCADLESEGYEVQPFIIPAVAVNAPHRRDRVWIIANRKHERLERRVQPRDSPQENTGRPESVYGGIGQLRAVQNLSLPDWGRDWREVAFATCDDSVDDGLPRIMDGTTISYAKWRKESLKAYGNAIVPQVAMEIFKAIKEAESIKSVFGKEGE